MIKLKTGQHSSRTLGQAMVEYALILALVAIAAGLTLAMTGDAIGNVFCNVVDNIGGETASPRPAQGNCGNPPPDLIADGNVGSLWGTIEWIRLHPQKETPFSP
ncbi:MAG: hypothetical protein ABI835_09410 [Chloroflexota bacterium]